MNVNQAIYEIKKFFQNNWHHMLYFVLIVYLANRVLLVCGFSKESVFYVAISSAILVVIKIFSTNKIIRYCLGVIHFVLFLAMISYFKIDAFSLRSVVFTYLLLYAYLFPDPLSPFLIIGILWINFFIIRKGYVPLPVRSSFLYGWVFQTTGYVSCFSFFRRLIKEKEKYKLLSITDSLTGTYTLKHIIERGNRLLKKKKDITLVIIDLNNFKQLNDNFGHMAGNAILKDIATLLIGKTEDFNGVIGRIGGDEFVILLQDDFHVDIKAFVDTLYETIHNQSFEVDPDLEKIRLSFAFGISHSTEATDADDMEKLLYTADVKMYYNKYQTKNDAIDFSSTRFFLPDQVLQYLNVLAEKDMYTYVHSEHVAKLGADLALQVGLPMERVAEVYIAGWLHDIGKSLIPNRILRKSGKLVAEEYKLIKEHIDIGINIIRRLEISDSIQKGIKYHHENWDGSGYPFSTKGEEIPIEGRILKIIDAFSAMTIKRVYREALSKQAALEEIIKYKGTHFDPELVDEFIKMQSREQKRNIIELVTEWIEKMQYRIPLNQSYEYEN